MKTKYTPGQWECSTIKDNDLWPVYGRGGYLVAEVLNANGYAENRANAALIAAAPDLLEALESILPLIDLAFNYDGDVFKLQHNDACDVHSQAIVAINKAKGE